MSATLRVESRYIPGGDAGTAATVRAMQRIVAASFATPVVRRQAVAIVRDVQPRDYPGQLATLRLWLDEHIRFLRDPYGAELLHTPAVMLREIAHIGFASVDCDDAAILAAALGRAVGFHARFVTVAFGRKDAPYCHIWTELQSPMGGQWVEMDVTRTSQQLPPGWVTRSRTVEA